MDLSRYADLFLTESREHLSAINHSLLELERGTAGAEPVDALFRAVHTVKGMSATMGYAAVAELSHEMETLLDQVRRGARVVTPGVMDVLFAAADALESSIELSVAGRTGEIRIGPVIERVRATAVSGRGTPVSVPAIAATSPSPPSLPARPTPAPSAPAVPSAAGALVVRVGVSPDAPLRGVRAFMAVQKAKGAGEVLDVQPPVEALQADAFGSGFTLRIVPRVAPDELERLIRSAGDIASVEIEAAGPAAPAAAPIAEPSPEPPSAPGGLPRRSQAIEALTDTGEFRTPGATPPDGAPLPEAASEAARPRQRNVRIDLRRLDALMNSIGELVITRGRLEQLAGAIADPALTEAVAQASRLVGDLQDQIMTSRMVPVWQVFDRFPRLVRDVARSLGKQVQFTIEGKEIELDRSMLDEIGDPIVHLLRNAIDHGIESPETRVAAGKPPAGRLTLVASRDRSAVLIRVTDDGKGIDRERVRRRAVDLGLVDPSRGELSDDELFRLISRPGFSTAQQVTEVSGRGVGIDAVQARVRALGGTVEIRSTPGQGTAITVRLPITLAIVRALLARVGQETYALPMTHVCETVDMAPGGRRTLRGREVLMLRDDVLPLLHLRDAVRLPREEHRRRQVVVLEVADRKAGLVVDELTGQQEIVVKQFDAVREGLSIFSGATILGDGAPALIVDVGSLL